MNDVQDPIPIVSWSCFYDASDSDAGTYLVSSAPTFDVTRASLAVILHHFQWKYIHVTRASLAVILRHFQWKYIVLVVDASRRFYVDLAAHVTYAIDEKQDFTVERVVHLKTTHGANHSLSVITDTIARGL